MRARLERRMLVTSSFLIGLPANTCPPPPRRPPEQRLLPRRIHHTRGPDFRRVKAWQPAHAFISSAPPLAAPRPRGPASPLDPPRSPIDSKVR